MRRTISWVSAAWGGFLLGAPLASAGCAVPAPPAPPPFASGPPALAAAATWRVRPASPAATIAAEPADAPALAATPAPPAPAGPSIEIEPPYKLGQHVGPRGQAERAELVRWNAGGRSGPAAQSDVHPLPRIIVDVDKVQGPLKAREVERLARKQLWIHVFSCYRLGAYKAPSLHGKTTLRLTVSRAGNVTGVRTTASTLPDREVVACLSARARSLALPRAKAGSTIHATLQVYPGDEPVEPPPSIMGPGPGELAREAIAATVGQAMPAFQSCYEAASTASPDLWGRLAIRFHVTESGAVDEAFETESRFPDEGLVRCVLRHARALDFPPPRGGDVRFVVPLRFSPGPPGQSTDR